MADFRTFRQQRGGGRGAISWTKRGGSSAADRNIGMLWAEHLLLTSQKWLTVSDWYGLFFDSLRAVDYSPRNIPTLKEFTNNLTLSPQVVKRKTYDSVKRQYVVQYRHEQTVVEEE